MSALADSSIFIGSIRGLVRRICLRSYPQRIQTMCSVAIREKYRIAAKKSHTYRSPALCVGVMRVWLHACTHIVRERRPEHDGFPGDGTLTTSRVTAYHIGILVVVSRLQEKLVTLNAASAAALLQTSREMSSARQAEKFSVVYCTRC